MATMERLVRRFNRLYGPGMTAELDWINSYPGYYTVCIVDELGIPCNYHFRTCNEFREWMDGVCFE